MYRLVIAEKASVAMNIARVLGVSNRHDGYLEGDGWLISWCIGHLAGLADASVYDPKYAKWRREDLPILLTKWQSIVSDGKREQFNKLRELLNRRDVSEVVNACDAGREGELIFRSVYDLSGCTKPVLRLWISSMEDTAIQEGFQHLRPGSDYDGLYQAALCRSKADWLVGINASRLFSIMYGCTLNVGRVVSPTLALLVQRETEIADFTSVPFYTVELDCDGVTVSSERVSVKEDASEIAAACKDAVVVIQAIDRKEKSEKAPALYDLTTLQREANRVLEYTAQQTLDFLQALYEKKLCTYPRTDSRFLTNDMKASVSELVSIAAKICRERMLEIVLTGQVCNSEKVTDHHAIVPTRSAAEAEVSALPAGEREILQLVSLGLLRAVCSPCRYAETMLTAECAGHRFTAKGKTVLDPGWKVYTEPAKETILPVGLEQGQTILVKGTRVKEGKTTPPKHHTEDTLLSNMESTGNPSDDAERRGIGTPATRAGILEKLVSSGFVERKKAKKVTNLIPTQKGNSLITVLPEALKSPFLTAEWEQRLGKVERGELSPDAFLDGIAELVTELVNTCQPVPGANELFPSGRERIGICPRCGGSVTESKKGFFCENPSCKFALWKDSRFFTAKKKTLTKSIAAALLKDGKVKLKGCFSERTGKTYDATVVLEDDGTKTNYKLIFERKQEP